MRIHVDINMNVKKEKMMTNVDCLMINMNQIGKINMKYFQKLINNYKNTKIKKLQY